MLYGNAMSNLEPVECEACGAQGKDMVARLCVDCENRRINAREDDKEDRRLQRK